MVDMYKEKSPLLVCLIGVMDGNKILLAKRKREPYAGYWGILGGRQTFGEKITNVVKKEVMEETGYKISNDIAQKGMYSEVLLDNEGKPKDHFVFVVNKAHLDKEAKQSQDIENTDIENFKWFNFPLSEEDAKKVIPTDLIMLNNFNSDTQVFKEFIMQEIKGDQTKLKIVGVKE